MGIVDRYVVREVLKTFLMTSGATLFLMTLGGGVKEGMKNGLPPHLILQTMPYLIPEMLRFIIPGCLLFAICSVFGRISSSNEVVALKAAGINPLRVYWPAFVVALLLSIGTFLLYDLCAVWGRPGLRAMMVESMDDIAYSFLNANHSYRRDGLSISVKGVEDQVLIQPKIDISSDKQGRKFNLVAERATLAVDQAGNGIRLEAFNGQLNVDGQVSMAFPGWYGHTIPLDGSQPSSADNLSPAALGTRDIRAQIVRERAWLNEIDQNTELGQQAEAERSRGKREARLYRLQAEVPRRWANGFACLGFSMVGIAVAVSIRSADTTSVFFLCFLPILLGYYPMLVVGEQLARQGIMPSLSVWLADAIVFAVGAILLYRNSRH